jgi:phosphatidate cytidylyltransferase
MAKQVLGLVYLPLLFGLLILIRRHDNGAIWLFFTLAIVFAGDTTALYTGTFFGRNKLIPSVSPGKTVEGALGGLLANVAVGTIVKLWLLPALTWPKVIGFSLAIGAAGQVGDLFESVIKRTSRIKDSGAILPGHGGILDRIDALLFAAPVAYLFVVHIF